MPVLWLVVAAAVLGYVLGGYLPPVSRLHWTLIGAVFGVLVLLLFEILAPGSLQRRLGRAVKEADHGWPDGTAEP